MVLGINHGTVHLLYSKCDILNGTQFRNAHLIFARCCVYLGRPAAKKNLESVSPHRYGFIILACWLLYHINL
jgi:hypothetical protein